MFERVLKTPLAFMEILEKLSTAQGNSVPKDLKHDRILRKNTTA